MPGEHQELRAPSLDDLRSARKRLGDRIRTTPLWEWGESRNAAIADTHAILKLELFQYGGSFKVRGALCNMLDLGPEELERGVTAVSAGNHAMAVSYAAKALGSHAKVVMPDNANPLRVESCRRYGAEVVLVPDVHTAFAEVKRIESEEGRRFIHPFDGYGVALGTGTLGLEWSEQTDPLDAVLVPIGGGGLCAGVANAIKKAWPSCAVYGIEPEGADTMHRSFAAGSPQSIDRVRTIADSLGAPHAESYSFELCRRFTDDLVKVTDRQIRDAMRVLFREAKLAVEPAGAAATAALLGPLAKDLQGRRVGLIVCGANIDEQTFASLLLEQED